MVARPPKAARFTEVLQAMSLPPSPAPIATGWSDSCRAGFAPAEGRCLSTAHYYIRVEAQEAGDNNFKLRYGVSTPDPDAVTALETQQQGSANAAPAFAEASYAFDLAENADGSTDRVALGTVSATDLEAAAVTYSIESGNDAGLFEIDGSTGALSYQGTGEDYEAETTSYELTVRASDGSLHSDVTVTVNITDLEEQTEPEPLISQQQQAAVQETVSEPDGGDLPDDSSTTGRVAVDGSATGEIADADDRDWFAVELEAGKTYQIDMSGARTGGGTMWWPDLHDIYDTDLFNTGVHDAVIIAPTRFVDGYGNLVLDFPGEDEQALFTPDEDGTYYLVVGNFSPGDTGTYTVQVTEIEDDFAASTETTGTVEVGGTATGESQYETDRDWFAVELTAGETYKIELLGGRSKGGTLQDPYIRGIHDANGRFIFDTTDYSSGPYSNSEVLFTPDEDGTYYVAAGSYVSGIRDEDVGTYTLQVSIDDFADDTDTTGTVEVGGSVTGEIEAQGDHDWFAVTLEADKTYQIDMEGSPTDAGTLANPFLRYMRDADGWKTFAGSDRDRGEGLNSRSTFTPDEDGTYYVVAASGGHLQAEDSHGRSLGTYTVSVEELVDAI